MVNVKRKHFIVIPAYNPDRKLMELTERLARYPQFQIIVVDDGSNLQAQTVFQMVSRFATVLVHKENRGKGRALKTALEYISQVKEEGSVVITADADGQHRVEDILKIYHAACENQEMLVLGVRKFTGNVPARSRLGNRMTAAVFRLMTGRKVSDTQTGLRGFSTSLIPQFLEVKGERYEYEMNVLMEAAKRKIGFAEVPIETVYIDGNQSSHFRVVSDSVKIYWNILKFLSSSFLCFCVDYAGFTVIGKCLEQVGIPVTLAVIVGNVSARIISSALNFYLNRTYVFHHQGNVWKAAAQYYTLAIGNLVANTLLLAMAVSRGGWNPMAAKLVIECMIFVVNYMIQNSMIFGNVK